MKKILFLLLLITTAMNGQTGTGNESEFDYGIKNNAAQTVTASDFITTTGANGTQGKILGENISLSVIPPVTHFTPIAANIKGYFQGVDNALGDIVATTAGNTTRVWFTGDATTIGAGNFYLSNATGKGTVANVSQSVTNDDNQKKYFTQDVIGQPFASNTLFPPGVYAGNLSASTTPNSARQRFTIELYKCDNSGAPIASGVPLAPVGDLGVTVILILDSGEINLVDGSVTNVPVSQSLAAQFSIAAGERIRYHVSAEKVGTVASNITESVWYGTSFNSYLDVPTPITSSGVSNLSTVTGATVTVALDNLNVGKENISNKAIDFTTVNNILYPTVQASKSYADTKESANQHKYLLGNFHNKITAQKTGIAQIKWLTFGDSFAQLIYKEIAPKLEKIAGNNLSGAYFNGSYRGVTNNSSTGSIVENTTDYQSWVTGLTTTFNTGATRTYGHSGGNASATKIKLYYVIEPGAGTFKIQVNGVDAVGYTNVSAAGTLGTLGIVTITQEKTSSNWTFVNLTGVVKVIGTGWEDTTVSGQMTINVSQGGIPLGGSLNSVTGYSTAMSNFNSFLADLQPTVFSFEMKENSSYYSTALNTFYTAISPNLVNTDVINIGSTPVFSGDADQVIQNEQLDVTSTTFGHKYYDTYKIFGNYAKLVSLGWNGDGIHLTADAHQYRGKLMVKDLALYQESEISPENVSNDRINTNYINSNIPTGTGSAGIFQAAGSVDVTIQSNNLSGGSATLNLFSGFSAVNGNSFIRGTSAELRLFASSVGGTGSKTTIYTGGIERTVVNSTGDFIHKAGTVNTNYASIISGDLVLGKRGNGSVPLITSRTASTTNSGLLVQSIQNSDVARTNESDVSFNTGVESSGAIVPLTTSGNAFGFYNSTNELFSIQRLGGVKIPNLSGTGTRSVVADSTGKLSATEVQPLVYTAFISQTGTSDPSATVLKNTLGGTVVWTRTVAGSYTATLTGAFTGNKTLVFLTNGSGATFVKGSQLTADSVNIQTFNSSAVLTDAILTNASIRIEVYP